MAPSLPGALLRRPTAATTSPILLSLSGPSTLKPSHTPLSRTPSRAANLIRRPKRPYTFTQLVQQTDGSTYTTRTTSPLALYKSTKDTRNHLLWQPSDRSLRNVEVDEAGKLAAFRDRFGRGWDMESAADKLEAASEAEAEAEADAVHGGEKGAAAAAAAPQDALSDLVARYSVQEEPAPARKKNTGKDGKKKK
ncbi:hypothetical protein F4781DRAFT_125478 [Annulohypoxylon bovei var. microspora]|nr:hypothetical protein F4781DRAFT_125478 [Annulohypoxylon bovei var. microspora]